MLIYVLEYSVGWVTFEFLKKLKKKFKKPKKSRSQCCVTDSCSDYCVVGLILENMQGPSQGNQN